MKTYAIVAGLLTSFVSGCATQPPVPLRVDLPTNVSILQVIQAPDNYQGTEVRWGGVIEKITNLKNETELEVIGKTLDKSARPILDANSPGRFLVRVQGFLEPTEFAIDREVTVVGKLSGSETRPIGEFEYRYPIVTAESYHLWGERIEPAYYYDPWFYDPWYWGYPRYPWWYYY